LTVYRCKYKWIFAKLAISRIHEKLNYLCKFGFIGVITFSCYARAIATSYIGIENVTQLVGNLDKKTVLCVNTILDEQSGYYQSICKGEIKDDLLMIRLYILYK
jgi:hypothetical protein